MRRLIILMSATAPALFATSMAHSQPIDPLADKVVHVAYEERAVVSVRVKPGVLTRVVLHPQEKIETAASGVAADCDNTRLLWCIRADKGTSVVWIRPKSGAVSNNVEIRTNVRDYSLELVVVPDTLIRNRKGKVIGRKTGPIHYRLIFEYPMNQMASADQKADPGASPGAPSILVTSQRPLPINWEYDFAATAQSQSFVPQLMFDDGRFTYLKFASDRELPVVFAINPDGQEQRLNMQMQDGLVVLHQTQAAFIIRLGQASVHIRNNGFGNGPMTPAHAGEAGNHGGR